MPASLLPRVLVSPKDRPEVSPIPAPISVNVSTLLAIVEASARVGIAWEQLLSKEPGLTFAHDIASPSRKADSCDARRTNDLQLDLAGSAMLSISRFFVIAFAKRTCACSVET
jgi:hypothetical protein